MMERNIYYYLGKRDAYAEFLAETYKTVKLPKIARLYKQIYGEEHFSHKWHVAQSMRENN